MPDDEKLVEVGTVHNNGASAKDEGFSWFTSAGVNFTDDDVADLDGEEEDLFFEATGLDIVEGLGMLAERRRALKVVSGFVWLMKRRSNPDLTYEEARKMVHLRDIFRTEEQEGANPPTNGASGGAARSKKHSRSLPKNGASGRGKSTSSPRVR